MRYMGGENKMRTPLRLPLVVATPTISHGIRVEELMSSFYPYLTLPEV